jgi:hypothetical protein
MQNKQDNRKKTAKARTVQLRDLKTRKDPKGGIVIINSGPGRP